MFARFDENPAMTLRVIKETKRYGRTDGRTDARTDGRTDGRTHGQRENSIPPTNKVCGAYNEDLKKEGKMRNSILISIYTVHFAFLKMYTKFENTGSNRS